MNTYGQIVPSSNRISGESVFCAATAADAFQKHADLTELVDDHESTEMFRTSLLQRLVKHRIFQWLSSISWGQVELIETAGKHNAHSFGAPGSGPRCQLLIRRPEFYSRVALGGALGLSESYMYGDWKTDDLVSMLQILFRRHNTAEQFRSTFGSIAQRVWRALEGVVGNTISRSRRQIAAHYDLSNEFFGLFLDSTWMYSCAYFEHEDMSLEEASKAKLRQICRKLSLRPDDHVLEIGTGWGGFGLHITENFDVRLTTTTISKEQYRKARERFGNSEAKNRIHLLMQDYRQLRGSFDKIVSLEMIEAVGEKNLGTYFRKCGELLKPGGRMVIQAIVMPEQRYEKYRRNVDFIQKYIFPGGFLPSISAIQESVGRTTDFRLESIEDLTPHYARTVLEWRRRYKSRCSDIRAMGFDESFIRMWEYYWCYCEAAFREQAVRVVQIVWDRPQN